MEKSNNEFDSLFNVKTLFEHLYNLIGITQDVILSNNRSVLTNDARRLLYFALQRKGASAANIAKRVGRSRSSIFVQLKSHRDLYETDPKYKSNCDKLISLIS